MNLDYLFGKDPIKGQEPYAHLTNADLQTLECPLGSPGWKATEMGSRRV